MTIFSNEEPPEPLAQNTKLSCLMAITEDSDFGCFQLADGRQIMIYTLFPLYTEERDLEKKNGSEHLLELIEKYEISPKQFY